MRDLSAWKRAEGRLRLLSEASIVLASSLNYQTTLETIARLAIPGFADLCVVDLVDEDGAVRRLATAHTDPDREALLRELGQAYRPDPDRPHLWLEPLRSGRPLLTAEVSDELLRSAARNAEHLRMLRRLGLKSILAVPLAARGRVLGSIAFVYGESGRCYGSDDLMLAKVLASRAALALDNARLYRQLQDREQRYRDLVQGLEAIVWEADPHTWRFTFVSRRAEDILGYPAEQWLTEPTFWTDHIHPEDRDGAVALCRQAVEDGRDHEFRVPDDRGRWAGGLDPGHRVRRAR